MVVDGKVIAASVLNRVREEVVVLGRAPRLGLLSCAPSFATETFIGVKKRRAAETGIEIVERELPGESQTDDVLDAMRELVRDTDGIVLQLPFPPSIDLGVLLATLPASHDVDAIGVEASERFAAGEGLLPPVVGAIAELVTHYDVTLSGKRAVVVGQGRLVGAPAASWLTRQGAAVTVCDRGEPDLGAHTKTADILVLGAGVPGLLMPDMIAPGSAIFDAGTSEEAGKLAGDADPACAERAGLFTPVPGGIGPVTVAVLFANLLALARAHGRVS